MHDCHKINRKVFCCYENCGASKNSGQDGQEHQRLLLVAAVLRVELARVEGRIEVAGIGVGVAVHRGAGAVEAALHLIDADQIFGRLGTVGGRFSGGAQTGCQSTTQARRHQARRH
mgnify:CR=1 FL=1